MEAARLLEGRINDFTLACDPFIPPPFVSYTLLLPKYLLWPPGAREWEASLGMAPVSTACVPPSQSTNKP